jgi:hypothetical protein
MPSKSFFIALLLAQCALVSAFAQPVSRVGREDAHIMSSDTAYSGPNPKAPPELSQFAFLIGSWRCDVRVKATDGPWQKYRATWVGRYILDGYAIADEYRMINEAGELIVHGMNFRSYSVERRTWVMRWLDATRSSWVELGPERLGGVRVSQETITFNLVDIFAPDAISRVTFSNISPDHFTWREDKSLDQGRTWTEFVVIDAHRVP